MRKYIIAIEKFIEEQGLSLFITLLTGTLIVLITIVSWFWPDIYTVISDNHVFETIVLVTLIEIVILLTKRNEASGLLEVFSGDSEAQAKILELLKHSPIEKALILSSGLGSRRLLIAPLINKGIRVEVLAQDPETSLDKKDVQRLYEAIDWIKFDIGDKNIEKLDLLFHANVSSLRAVVLYETYSKVRHAFIGWYIYSDQNTTVRGSQHPTLYISTRSKSGEQIVQWIESMIDQSRKESRQIPAKAQSDI